MFVGNSVFPISFTLEKVAEIVEKALLKKNWRNFEKGDIKLVLTPFFLFYYDAVFGEKGKPNGKTRRGLLALNGETAELSKELAESMPDEAELLKELPDEYALVIKKAIFSKKEAEKIALLKTASFLGTDRKNVVLSGFKEIYYPVWLAFATVAGETHEFEISAVTGKMLGEEKVPEREKGFVELTKETLEELKEPGAWLRYSREIVAIGGKKLAEKKGNKGKEPAVKKGSGWKMPVGKKAIVRIFRKPAFWISLALVIAIVAVALLL